jgi:hypothetical protein
MNIPTLRLANQRLSNQCNTAAEVVSWLGAVQAQDYNQALWAIASRMQHGTAADVEAAIASGQIIRTWPMRGTIHFVPAQDAAWMVGLTAVKMRSTQLRRQRELGLDEAVIATCGKLLKKALKGAKYLPRPEVMALFESHGISTAGQRGIHILWNLAQDGLICIGPMVGKQPSFALLNEWAPGQKRYTKEEALRTLALRYIQSHGPATIRDFAAWTKLTLTESKQAFLLAGADTGSQEFNGTEYWLPAQLPKSKPRRVYLLAAFDEYFIGYKDRSAVIDPAHKDLVVPGGNGVFKPTVLVDGQIAGTWQRTVNKSGVTITISPFWKLDVSTEEFQQAAKPYGEFLGKSVTISL